MWLLLTPLLLCSLKSGFLSAVRVPVLSSPATGARYWRFRVTSAKCMSRDKATIPTRLAISLSQRNMMRRAVRPAGVRTAPRKSGSQGPYIEPSMWTVYTRLCIELVRGCHISIFPNSTFTSPSNFFSKGRMTSTTATILHSSGFTTK